MKVSKQIQDDENLALGKPAFQISSRWLGAISARAFPKLAVDGNMGPVYNNGGCSHTEQETNPWWAVDLGNKYKLRTVEIRNRLAVRESTVLPYFSNNYIKEQI